MVINVLVVKATDNVFDVFREDAITKEPIWMLSRISPENILDELSEMGEIKLTYRDRQIEAIFAKNDRKE